MRLASAASSPAPPAPSRLARTSTLALLLLVGSVESYQGTICDNTQYGTSLCDGTFWGAEVVLDGQRISGTIPPHMINNARAGLTKLHLDNNEISGTVPPTTGELSELQELRLDNNDLSGTIPPQLGGISWLNQLWLYSNKISGTIPSQLNNLPLTACRLGRNLFACPLPALPDCCLEPVGGFDPPECNYLPPPSPLLPPPPSREIVIGTTAKHWAQIPSMPRSYSVEVGDTLVFIYPLWDVDVWSMPSSACDFAAAGFEYGPYKLADSSHGGGTGAGAANRFEYPMADVGTFYFASRTYCSLGQKITVFVSATAPRPRRPRRLPYPRRRPRRLDRRRPPRRHHCHPTPAAAGPALVTSSAPLSAGSAPPPSWCCVCSPGSTSSGAK